MLRAKPPRYWRRTVKTGEFNISFIQILEGIEAGESVLLRPPTLPDKEKNRQQTENPKRHQKENKPKRDKREGKAE